VSVSVVRNYTHNNFLLFVRNYLVSPLIINFSKKKLQSLYSAIIAYTWDHFLNDPSQPEWLVRFPMVKASVRAMDAVTEFMAQSDLVKSKNVAIENFFVSGASKRGWTTWLVGAVDKRASFIIPIVLDAINFIQFSHHQWKSYGGWTFALSDYTDMNIMSRIDDPNMLLLAEQEDPYYFKERLTMPKLVVNAVLDEFQQPDDTHYWWSEMPEPKHFIMTPNAEHSMATGILEAVPAISAWMQYHLRGDVVPSFTWEINNSTGEIVATLDNHGIVHEASMWAATSCGTNVGNAVNDGGSRRDFRVAMLDNPCGCGIFADGMCANFKSIWKQTTLTETTVKGKRTYSATVPAPAEGKWTAFFIDIKYKKPASGEIVSLPTPEVNGLFPKDLAGRLEFTTEVSIFPDTFPYPDCSGSGCKTLLV
jgi:PhoPQ-activated pathogenicity-related protein